MSDILSPGDDADGDFVEADVETVEVDGDDVLDPDANDDLIDSADADVIAVEGDESLRD